jgi:hypothetical protein
MSRNLSSTIYSEGKIQSLQRTRDAAQNVSILPMNRHLFNNIDTLTSESLEGSYILTCSQSKSKDQTIPLPTFIEIL